MEGVSPLSVIRQMMDPTPHFGRGRRRRRQDREEEYDDDGPKSGTTGARIKITRNLLLFKDPEGRRKPWLDMGVGLAVEMDNTRLQPVARIKIKDIISIKVFPSGL